MQVKIGPVQMQNVVTLAQCPHETEIVHPRVEALQAFRQATQVGIVAMLWKHEDTQLPPLGRTVPRKLLGHDIVFVLGALIFPGVYTDTTSPGQAQST